MRTSPLSVSLFILAVVVTAGTFIAGSDPLVERKDIPTKVTVARKTDLTTGAVLGESSFASETRIFNIQSEHFSKQPNGFTVIPATEHFLIGEVSPITKKLMGSRAMSLLMYDEASVSFGKAIQAYTYNTLNGRWMQIPAFVDRAAHSVAVFHKPGRTHIMLVETNGASSPRFAFGIHRVLEEAVRQAEAQGSIVSMSI